MNNFNQYPESKHQNRTTAGLIIIAIGAVLLLKSLGWILYPFWLFSWPMLLIVIGVLNGIRHNFRNAAWLIMILVGAFFLLNNIIGFVFAHLFWPIILIAVGVRMITNRHPHYFRDRWERKPGYGPTMDIPVE